MSRAAVWSPAAAGGAPWQVPRVVAALLLGLLLAGCATRPTPIDRDALSGRLSVRVAATADVAERAANMGFELRGSPQVGEIDFSTPLGSVVAQARWAPGRVVLVTPQGEQAFADLDSLSREALGEAVPVAALFDWLRGRPWPGASHEARADGTGFAQLGWQVELGNFAAGQVTARRTQPPAVTVRAVLDRG